MVKPVLLGTLKVGDKFSFSSKALSGFKIFYTIQSISSNTCIECVSNFGKTYIFCDVVHVFPMREVDGNDC